MEKPQFELTNEQRKYLGLIPVEKHWELVQMFGTYLYFDGDIMRKVIKVDENSYTERELNEKTAENRTILLPKTKKGKPKKLNKTAARSFSFIGVHFSYSQDGINLMNYTTRRTYFFENFESDKNINDLKGWLDKWISETSEKDLEEIEAFKNAKREQFKYREGDFFAFKIGRRQWGFGRILIDVKKRIKIDNLKENKHYGLTSLMLVPLIVKVYHKISDNTDIDLKELSETAALPSQTIDDSNIFYGEYPIIGNKPLEEADHDMLISYSRSITLGDTSIYLQYGFIYRETKSSRFKKYLFLENEDPNKMPFENPYRNEGVGFRLGFDYLKECIAAQSNDPYWASDSFYIKYDLRNPKNKQIKTEIFNAFGLDADKSYEENLQLPETKGFFKKIWGKF